MTLSEIQKQVLQELDEYEAGNSNMTSDDDISARLISCIDRAQKHLAQVKKIPRYVKLSDLEQNENKTVYILPSDFLSIKNTRYKKKIRKVGFIVETRGFVLSDNINPQDVSIEYYAMPKTIDDKTPSNTELELSADIQIALPTLAAIYVANSSDPMLDTSELYRKYEMMMSDINTTNIGSVTITKYPVF